MTVVVAGTDKFENQVGSGLFSAPGSTCAALASGGAKRVDLGRARDLNGDGQVVFPGRIAGTLGPGAWRLEARCSYSLAGLAGTAADSSAVTVA